jgi:hypothetical protein
LGLEFNMVQVVLADMEFVAYRVYPLDP